MRKVTSLCVLAAALIAFGCSEDNGGGGGGGGDGGQGGGGQGGGGGDGGSAVPEACHEPTLDAALCDPASATFSLDSTNPWYPLTVGLRVVLEGDVDGVTERVEREVLAETAMVAGVETHVLEHVAYEDGELLEIARNYYVEAGDGTVCYFGEDVEFYENGQLVGTEGTWLADGNDAKPGVIMAASPAVGQVYFQENAPANEAMDMGRVDELGASATYAGVAYDDVLVIQDSNPFDGCEEEPKHYVAGIGEVRDVELDMIEFTQPTN